MPVLDYQISTTGLISNVSGQGRLSSQLPAFIYITTNDILNDVLISGYLNELRATYQVQFSNFQMALVYTVDSGPVLLRILISGNNVDLENPSVSGSVFGPGSSTNNALARWSGTTGTQLSNSGAILDNSNNLILNSLTLTIPLAFTSGGTGLSTIAQGSILYSASANSIAELVKDTNASRYLSNQGAFNAPLWAQVNLVNGVTGNLPVTNLNSGTGATASTFWRGDATWGALTSSITGTANQVLVNATSGSPVTGAATLTLANNAILPGTGGITLPQGTTAQRAGAAGTIRFNSQNTVFESTADGITWDTIETSAIGVVSVTGTTNRITATPTTGNVIVDLSSSYVGQSSITTLGTITTGTWSATTIATIKGGTGLTAYTTGDTLYASATNVLSKLAGNITIVKQYLSQTGDGAVSSAPAWATISGSDVTGAALTRVNDTNVTLTLAGAPTTALLNATSLTLGWLGQLGLTRGGTNASLVADNGGIVYSSASAFAILASTVTARQMLQSGASAAPAWSTSTWPATTTINQILYSSSANTIAGLATANKALLTTNATGVPSLTALALDGQIIIGSTAGVPSAATLTQGTGVTITNAGNSITISATGSGGTVTSVTGTANQIDSTGGATPVLSLSSTIVAPGSLAVTSLTASRAVVTDGSKLLTSSATTAAEIGFVSGVTSALQTQINGKISQNGAQIYAASSNGTDSYTITLSPVPSAYVVGMVVNFMADVANTSTASLNCNGLGDIVIRKNLNQVLFSGDIGATQIVEVVYDGTFFQMQSPLGRTSVTSVATGTGLRGGTITSGGTINLSVFNTCNVRLSASTGVAITTSDVTSSTNIYAVPYKGGEIAVYNATTSVWEYFQLASQLTVAIPATGTFTSNAVDVFAFNNNTGTLSLTLETWTNLTTRATALTTQDNVLVLTGFPNARYLGSFRTNASNQVVDSIANRWLWNYYNRVAKAMLATPTGTVTWNYTLTTLRQANASSALQLNFMIGVSEDLVQAQVLTTFDNTNTAEAVVGIGLDSTTTQAANCIYQRGRVTAAAGCSVGAMYNGYPGIGSHSLMWLEASQAVGTTTWFGNVTGGSITGLSGIWGTIYC